MSVEVALLPVLILFLAWVILLWTWRNTIRRCWSEPVLRHQVLIIESDDWGPGPPLHGERLSLLAGMLANHRDVDGRPAIMTLGVVLAVPDSIVMRFSGLDVYQRIDLGDTRCASVLASMEQGAAKGVFALQLHGMEHYWPPALLHAARGHDELRSWLLDQEFPAYEELPSPLQSRWVNGEQLPSRPLDAESIARAVREETAAFQRILRFPPRVAVPPTFIWTRDVENAWIAAGIDTIITPGRRYTARDAAGQPSEADISILNGEAAGPMTSYLVRDIYFEPLRGHVPDRVLGEVHKRFQLGRPALLETHRSNFIGSEKDFEYSLLQLGSLLEDARKCWPELRFISPQELSRLYRNRPAEWIVQAWPARLHVWLLRLAGIPRLCKLAWLSGLVFPAVLLLWLSVSIARREGIPA